MIDVDAHRPLVAVIATSLAAVFDGVVADGELAFLEGAEAFQGVAIAAVDDVAYFGTQTTADGDTFALYAVDPKAQIAIPEPGREASSSPPEELSREEGTMVWTPEAGENAPGDAARNSGDVTVAGGSPESAPSREELLEHLLDLTIEHPSRLWRGFRQRYFNRERVSRLIDLDDEVLVQVARDAELFVAQIPARGRR